MKIIIATDAAPPQVNGVVTTLWNTIHILRKRGIEVHILEPSQFKVLPFQLYPSVDFIWNVWAVGSRIKGINPDAVHIATEGPIGLATRLHCEEHKLNYSSSYHTKFPEYLKDILPFIPISWPYNYLKWIHNKSGCILVTNQDMKDELTKRGFNKDKMRIWARGADIDLFNPSKRDNNLYKDLKKPILFYVGRVSREKNIDAFCQVESEGSKVIIGDGPIRNRLEKEYPNVQFVGMKHGTDLARHIASGDLFVFPSLWDTFGVVMIEVNACGIPVAAFPATGPREYIVNGVNGYINEDLNIAIDNALNIPNKSCRTFVEENYTWDRCVEIFVNSLQRG